jgi:hypothetical protein
MQQKIVAFAKDQGYEFTVDELTESELGGVTGGALYTTLKIDSLDRKDVIGWTDTALSSLPGISEGKISTP